ncbi:MAG: PilZ domain-containing protein [Pyrinomonadaceae bacterium]
MEDKIPRQDKRIGVPLEVVLESSSGKREVRISDLSMGGCYIDSIAGVSQGENVRFTLSLPGRGAAELSGTVVYVHDGIGFGLQFSALSDEQQDVLRQVIEANGGSS